MPVADELASEESMLPSTEDLRLGNLHPFDIEGDGKGRFVIEEVEDAVPPRNEVQFREVYPEMVHAVAPEYPRQAKTLGLEGDVIVQALVGPGGEVLDAVVYVSSGMKLKIVCLKM